MPKTWLVTGCSGGLGRQIARSALAAGHRLVATSRRASSLNDLPAGVRVVELDVTDPAQCEAAVQAAVETFGGLDVVVNNAGYADVAAFEDMPPAVFQAQMDANFSGVVNMSRAALPVMRAQGGGHLIQVSSVGDRVAVPGLAGYQAAKHAVNGFSAVLALETAPLGIKVTVLEPGGMRTEWAGSSMTTLPLSEAYRQVIAPVEASLRAASGHQPGDPARIAQVLLDLVENPNPPTRLLLGSDAVEVAQQAAASLATADAKWRTVSESTDYR
ncbi:SDR family NAD(P)-dependent oxidoreductase [Paractinoplanes atraurantiacus]|uniref:NADP-dependent 3-hydroxy acid dehydrogenase YdfG n=1 Tax=Paractinoplanes atraurantiacus TaxID=1036182 RepID=A0A285GJU1_9ACTN|nr:SDR family NAD(P)-dependent oxidoreductase [Actinoplanes atraurantiacus]SNY23837.1 NADP-dependent 3-hydroxy acid dehydrogenase YdfG [Actinoplanes atraurantiacus]